jgi:hypothetical protein
MNSPDPYVECPFPGGGKSLVIATHRLAVSSDARIFGVELVNRTSFPRHHVAKVPQTKAGIADFNQRWWTELGSP